MNNNSEKNSKFKLEFVSGPEEEPATNRDKDTYLTKIPFPGCMKCKHLIIPQWGKAGLRCEAYPVRIPTEILLGYIDHTKPYKDDQGIQFELLEDPDKEKRRIKALRGK